MSGEYHEKAARVATELGSRRAFEQPGLGLDWVWKRFRRARVQTRFVSRYQVASIVYQEVIRHAMHNKIYIQERCK